MNWLLYIFTAVYKTSKYPIRINQNANSILRKLSQPKRRAITGVERRERKRETKQGTQRDDKRKLQSGGGRERERKKEEASGRLI